jgi:hypothetical protein
MAAVIWETLRTRRAGARFDTSARSSGCSSSNGCENKSDM